MKLYEFYNQPDSILVFAHNEIEAANLLAQKFGQFTTNDINIEHFDDYSVLNLGYLKYDFWAHEIKLGIVE
jgi:hypothetical protein